jgi:hypothetical protein
MGLLWIALFIISIMFTVLAVIYKQRRLFTVVSMISIGITPLLAIKDILGRVESGDIAGVIDIYPTMLWVFIIVFIVVSAINIVAIKTGDNNA